MTRFVVDCGAVLHLVGEGIQIPAEHQLFAPTLLRSQTLSALHQAVHRGELRRTPPSTGSPASGPCRSASSATPSSGAEPGNSPTNSAGPRPTTPSTSPSPNSRPTRSSPLTRNWPAELKASSPQPRSRRCKQPDIPVGDPGPRAQHRGTWPSGSKPQALAPGSRPGPGFAPARGTQPSGAPPGSVLGSRPPRSGLRTCGSPWPRGRGRSGGPRRPGGGRDRRR